MQSVTSYCLVLVLHSRRFLWKEIGFLWGSEANELFGVSSSFGEENLERGIT
jgi:hypothetical protein